MEEEKFISKFDGTTNDRLLSLLNENQGVFPFDSELNEQSQHGVTNSVIAKEINAIKDATTNNKGYFLTEESLKAVYPIANEGSKAYVGENYPYKIYLFQNGLWVYTNQTGGNENFSAGEFYTKTQIDQQHQSINNEIIRVEKGANFEIVRYTTNITTTRLLVDEKSRRKGLLLAYFKEGKSIIEQYISDDTSQEEWVKDENWHVEFNIIGRITSEGGFVILNGKTANRFSFSCGDGTEASGQWAVSFGYRNIASGNYAFVGGYLCTASGDYALAGGYKTTASGNTAIAYGYNSSATNTRSIALGDSAKSTGDNGVAIGCKVEAKKDSVALGYGSKAYGNHSISIGYNNVANADGATIMGLQNTANGGNSFCCGTNNTTDGSSGFAMGDGNRANGFASIAFNRKSECNADNGISLGYSTICNSYAGMAIGYVNEPDEESQAKSYNATNMAFCIGNGVDNSGTLTRGNAFKVKFDGTVYSDNTSVQPNADYAEMFEWFDGNELSEDRVGRFVALKGNKIILASSNDKPIGVISAAPSIIGDAPMRWQGKFMNDQWGRPIYEDIEVRYTETISETDENGEVILKEVEKTRIDKVRKINPNYDPNQEYIPRENRKEWDAVGLLGKLLVEQDGTLIEGGYCKPITNGIATTAESGYYVMEIINESQAQILFR